MFKEHVIQYRKGTLQAMQYISVKTHMFLILSVKDCFEYLESIFNFTYCPCPLQNLHFVLFINAKYSNILHCVCELPSCLSLLSFLSAFDQAPTGWLLFSKSDRSYRQFQLSICLSCVCFTQFLCLCMSHYLVESWHLSNILQNLWILAPISLFSGIVYLFSDLVRLYY